MLAIAHKVFALKGSSVPVALSALFFVVGAMSLEAVFTASLDAVTVIRNSCDLIRKFRERPKNFGDMTQLQWKGCMKRAKAMQPVSFPVGIFREMEAQVPIIVCLGGNSKSVATCC